MEIFSPKLKKCVNIQESSDNVYVINDYKTGKTLLTNTIGKEILTLCDGNHSLKEITTHILDLFEGVNQSACEEDVKSFLQVLQEKGIIYNKKKECSC
jgi:hypothetical protein